MMLYRATMKPAPWKVPFRQVWCETFISMLRQVLWCHVVIRVFPKVHDFGSDSFADVYRKEPAFMVDQLGFLLPGHVGSLPR